MSAARAFDAGVSLEISLITPEEVPLAVFGGEVSRCVHALLEKSSIEFVGGAFAEVPASDQVVVHPGDRRLHPARVIALPELYGPSVRGMRLGEHGFLPTDRFARVPEAGPVFAAGDATEFPIKHEAVGS